MSRIGEPPRGLGPASRTETGPDAGVPATRRSAGRRGRWRRVVVGLVVVLLVAVLATASLVVWAVRRPYPSTTGQVTVPGLDGAVEVVRDASGFPVITATTSADLWRAQGYVHASERFFQMDTWRHVGAGRTAELFGDSALPSDRFLRTLGWADVARTELAGLPAETVAQLEAYADGVNAYLADRPAGAVDLAYTVLGLQGPTPAPEPWEPLDTLVFLKVMAWDLRSNLDAELERGILAGELSADALDDLYPGYDDSPVIVPGTGPPPGDPDDLVAAEPAIGQALADVARRVAAVERVTGARTDGVGSNSWVLAGDRTADGAPLLANDPHLAIQMPSIWYVNTLRCAARTATCRDDVAGFSFPGVPGVAIGHNDRIAWGFTNLAPDVMDLFVERVDPDDPTRYDVDGAWRDMTVTTETLRSSSGRTETLEVRRTRHGPVISDTYGALGAFDPAAVGAGTGGAYAVALRWTALDPTDTASAILGLNRAGSWREFRAAAARFDVPAQNLVFADVDGTIGYQAPGVVPVRAGGDGRTPVPGWTGDFDWTGTVPADEMPSIRDPGRGWLVTANNPAVGTDYPHLLTTDWDLGYRAQRIVDLVEATPTGVTVDDARRWQLDTFDASAARLIPALRAAAARARPVDPDVAAAVALFDGWDHQLAADSAAAAYYAATWRAVLDLGFADDLPAAQPPRGNARWFAIVDEQLDRPDSPWWDDASTLAVEQRDDVLAAALTRAAAELRERLGDDPSAWRWGDLHTATFRNGTLGESGVGVVEARFNRGPYPVGGGSSIVNATGWDASVGYEVTAVPSMRMVVSLAGRPTAAVVHTTGQSGHPDHPHSTDLVDPWRTGDLRPLPWDADEIADPERLDLVPGR